MSFGASKNKRIADDYITKEHGSISNERDKIDPVKMATAAQLAKRKILTPKRSMSRHGGQFYRSPARLERERRLRKEENNRLYEHVSNKRKIGTPQPSSTTTPASNPFAQNSFGQPPQQTFGAVGGITFGQQAQSFPPGIQTPSQSGFNFNPNSDPSIKNPFANLNGNNSFPAPSQPSFGGPNGNSGNQFGGFGRQDSGDTMMDSPEKKQPTTNTFGQSQPPGPPIFSFGQNGSTAQPSGGLFGAQPTPSNASNGLFGGIEKPSEPKQGAPAPGGLFGTPTPPTTESHAGNSFANIFSQALSQPPVTQATSSTPLHSGQTTATTQPLAGSQWGQTISTEQPPSSVKFGEQPATAAPNSLFGDIKPLPDQAGTSLFGLSPAQKPTETKGPIFSFGQPVSSQAPPQTTPQADNTNKSFAFGTTPNFGAPNTVDGKSAEKPSLFGGIPKLPEPEKPAESEKSAEPKNPFASLFAASSPTSTAQPPNQPSTATKPPFKFGESSTAGSAAPKSFFNTGGSSAAPGPAPEAPKVPFKFGEASASSGLAPATSNPPSQSTSSLFSNISKAPETSSNGLFNWNKSPATTEPNNEAPASGQDIYGASASKAPENKVSAPLVLDESVYNPDTLCPKQHAIKSVKMQHLFASNLSDTRIKELFRQAEQANIPLPQFAAETEEVIPINEQSRPRAEGRSFPSGKDSSTSSADTERPKKRLFQTFEQDSPASQGAAPPSANKPASTPFGSSAATTVQSSNSSPAAVTPKPVATGQVTRKPIFPQSATSIPSFLNGEGYKEFDNNDKLRALNRQFQKKIASVDVSAHDIESIVRYYVASRSNIGADIGLYQRRYAGAKRKNDEAEEPVVPSAYKKVRSEGPENSQSAQLGLSGPTFGSGSTSIASNTPSALSVAPSTTFGQSSTMSSAFGQQATGTGAFQNNSSAPQASTPSPAKPTEQNRASQIFGNLIEKSPQKTQSQMQQNENKPGNVFAGIQPLPNAPVVGSPAKATKSSAFSPSKSTFGQPTTSTTPSKPTFAFQPSTTPAKSPPKAQGFSFSGTVTDGFSSFGKKAESGAKKRRSEELEDYDSDEDSQAEGRRELEERERQKRAKYESIAKSGFKPALASSSASQAAALSFDSKSNSSEGAPSVKSPVRNSPFEQSTSGSDKADDEDESEDIDNEERDGNFEVDDDEDEEESGKDEHDSIQHGSEERQPSTDEELSANEIEQEIASNPNAYKSLFDRIEAPQTKENSTIDPEKTPAIMNSTAKNPSFKPSVIFSEIGKSTPEQPAFSPFTPSTEPYKPSTTFNWSPAAPTTVDTGSVLGGATAQGDYTKFEGLFGSRPSTPSQLGQPATSTSAPVDHTWKQGSAIKFGTPDKSKDAPTINFTAPSPSIRDGEAAPKPFSGSLFGKAAPSSASKPGDANLGFSFGSSHPAPGFLSVADHLGVNSTTSSAISSRASSPGVTDNESVATDNTSTEDQPPPDVQADYKDSRAGEENDECLFEQKLVIALRLANSTTETRKEPKGTWVTMGKGPLRILKNKEGKTRVVIRNETNGNIIVNEYLQPQWKWETVEQKGKSGAVKGAFVQNGVLNQWIVKINKAMVDGLQELLEVERRRMAGKA